MPYIIDGHNLIPKVGLRLNSIDDEMDLISILQEFCRLEHRQVEVFFDGAPQAQTRKLGAVTAHFVRLGTSARNWTVISSDREVQTEARAVRAEVMSSDSFAGMLKQARNSAPKPNNDRKISPQEVDEWLKIFERRKPK